MDASSRFLIVAGGDGSEQSLATLRLAVAEARLRHGHVRVVTAWHYPRVHIDTYHANIEELSQADALRIVQ